jgi:hypothetical protein
MGDFIVVIIVIVCAILIVSYKIFFKARDATIHAD